MTASKTLYLKDIKEFMRRHKLTRTEFGKRFAKSPNYVFDLERGRAPTLDNVDRVDAAMKEFEEEKNAN